MFFYNPVIPAKAGIQLINEFPREWGNWLCPLRGMFLIAGFRPSPE
jgi:hypothetical protein